MEVELTPAQAAPLLGVASEVLRVLIAGGADWHYVRTAAGVETRSGDGTLLCFQALTPGGQRSGAARLYRQSADPMLDDAETHSWSA